jgi:hypothetical protein
MLYQNCWGGKLQFLINNPQEVPMHIKFLNQAKTYLPPQKKKKADYTHKMVSTISRV